MSCFFFKLLQQIVFIYLDVTDYLKILDFFYLALFCTVLSLPWNDWPVWLLFLL